MVCVTCFLIPIGIWVWFNFMMPILTKIKALIWPGKSEETPKQQEDADSKTESVSQDEVKLKCPFSGKKVAAEVESKKTS